MLCSRAEDFCSRAPASCRRAWPSPVTKNNAARKLTMRNGGIATYQRPNPSNASLKMFTPSILFTKASAVHPRWADLLQCACPVIRRTCDRALSKSFVRFTDLEGAEAHRVGHIVHCKGHGEGDDRYASLARHPSSERF